MKVEIGSWNKKPHYSVVGNPQDFYLYINSEEVTSNNWSNWIKGREASSLHGKLKRLHKKDKKAFIELFKEEFDKHRK